MHKEESRGTMRDIDAIVAGAGHNGLVAACYLARAGLKVLVLEAHETPGGMTATNPMSPEAPEHMINEASAQASLFRMTSINHDLELESKFGLRQRLVDPIHVQLNPDGNESIGTWRDANRTAKEISFFSKKDAATWLELSESIDRLIKVGLPFAMQSPVKPGARTIMKVLGGAIKNGRHVKEIARLISGSQAGVMEELFETDIVRAIPLVGLPFMDPRSDLSAFSLIYLGVLQRWGVAMFEGGTGSFPKALIRCLEASGGEVRTKAVVRKMVVKEGRVRGVELDSGEEIFAKHGVLTAFSPKAVLNYMLPEGLLGNELQVRAKDIPTSTRGFADYGLNIALKGRIEPRRHQKWRDNKELGGDLRLSSLQWATYEQALKAYEDSIKGEIPEGIYGLSQVHSAFDPSLAPKGQDTLWFWSGLVPFDPKIGWDQARDLVADKIVSNCSKYYDGLDELEIARRPLAPPDIAKRFNAIDGSVYHCDPYLTRFGPGRPARGLAGYKTPIPGLFLSGSGTHPSAGICGLPGRNAALTMLKNIK